MVLLPEHNVVVYHLSLSAGLLFPPHPNAQTGVQVSGGTYMKTVPLKAFTASTTYCAADYLAIFVTSTKERVQFFFLLHTVLKNK